MGLASPENVKSGLQLPGNTGSVPLFNANVLSTEMADNDIGHEPQKHQFQQQLLSAFAGGRLGPSSEPEARLELGLMLEELMRQNSASLNPADQETIVAHSLREMFGFGPIDDLIKDQEISEILVNGPRQVV